jgi:hypothetical protein
MALKPNKTVCGIPVHIAGSIFHKDAGGSPTVNEREAVGAYRRAAISKPGAKRLAEALGLRLPRAGYEIKLCTDQYLVHNGAGFDVVRRAHGDFSGTTKRRRRR